MADDKSSSLPPCESVEDLKKSLDAEKRKNVLLEAEIRVLKSSHVNLVCLYSRVVSFDQYTSKL